MPLTNIEVRNAKPREKAYKLTDARGLFLLVIPAGGKYWRFKYRFNGKEKQLGLGTYPDVSLANARAAREARGLKANGIDPSKIRREAKARASADRLATQAASRVRVVAGIDGAMEIWKGRSMVKLTTDEARTVNELLNKLIA